MKPETHKLSKECKKVVKTDRRIVTNKDSIINSSVSQTNTNKYSLYGKGYSASKYTICSNEKSKDNHGNNHQSDNSPSSAFMLKHEINEWRKHEAISNTIKNKLSQWENFNTIKDPPAETIHFSSPASSIQQSNSHTNIESYLGGLANVDERTDENINDNDNGENKTVRIMRTLDDYLVPHSFSVASQSPNISFSTLDALENAEKLVQEAKRKIIEASYDISIVDYNTERQSRIADLDEDELYIRDIVSAQFQKANGQISSNTIFLADKTSNFVINSLPRTQRITSKETIERVGVRCHETKKKMESCKECLMSKDKQELRKKMLLEKFHSQKAARVDIKPQLTLKNMERLDLLPTEINCETTMKNVKTYEFKGESTKPTIINESLIDVAIQTSLCELSREDKVPSNKLTGLSVDFLQSSSSKCVNQQGITKNSGMHLNESKCINHKEKTSKEKNGEESKISFLDFLCHIADLEKIESTTFERIATHGNNSDEYTQYSEGDKNIYYDFNYKKISLELPNVRKFDDIMDNMDRKIENISKGIEIFENEFFPVKIHHKITDDVPVATQFINKNTSSLIAEKIIESPKRKINIKKLNSRNKFNDAQTAVKFILKPRTRISSSESTESSETILPPARFSTPLSNYRYVDVPAINIENKNSPDIIEEIFIPITEPDLMNDISNVPITRNKFSSISSIDVNSPGIQNKITAVNIDTDSKSIVENDEEKSAKNIQSNAIEPSLPPHLNQQSDENSKSKIDNTQKNLYTKLSDNKKDFDSEINMVDHHLKVVISSDIKPVTIAENFQESLGNHSKENNPNNLNLHESMQDGDTANSDIDEKNNSIDNKEHSNMVILDKMNVTSTELSIRDRTSLDVSAIYSENFEPSLVTELKSISKDIESDKNKSLVLIEENSTKINLIDEVIDEAKNIKIFAAETSNHLNENKKETSLTQLSKSFNSNYTNSNKKNASDGNTVSISSSSTSSLRKLSINSASSVQTLNETKAKLSTDDRYSEGEFYLPSSCCSYSLGEIRIAKRDPQHNINNHVVNSPTMVSNSSAQSPGEILETDVDLNSSIGKELNK
ncbi:hypothetical protein PV327_006753 [Microctonus hyperodae]|uniref:Uncharacterized protein n=1 Tax=Microctonus hyperodae TaxID=165561 RepID=A0AA39F4Y7_MICHY|nr:hypothetical protein PV327_006753 [Microctonus hyperodae]